MTHPDTARLVQAAERAMPIEIRNPRDARAATAAVLRALADMDCTWDDAALDRLADHIDQENRRGQ